jgi:serine/threonine protein kinase
LKCFARKILRPFAGRNNDDDIANETRAMEKHCQLGHENLIEIYDHGTLRTNLPFYFIDMELCGVNLDEYIQGYVTGVHGLLDWSQAIQDGQGDFQIFAIFQQILIGLIFIHDHGEVHRDLTPQNNKDKRRLCADLQFCIRRRAVSGRLRTSVSLLAERHDCSPPPAGGEDRATKPQSS